MSLCWTLTPLSAFTMVWYQAFDRHTLRSLDIISSQDVALVAGSITTVPLGIELNCEDNGQPTVVVLLPSAVNEGGPFRLAAYVQVLPPTTAELVVPVLANHSQWLPAGSVLGRLVTLTSEEFLLHLSTAVVAGPLTLAPRSKPRHSSEQTIPGGIHLPTSPYPRRLETSELDLPEPKLE